LLKEKVEGRVDFWTNRPTRHGFGMRPGWGFSDHFGHVFSAALPIVGTDADLDPTDIDGCRERWGPSLASEGRALRRACKLPVK